MTRLAAIALAACLAAAPALAPAQDGPFVERTSPHDVETTIDRLAAAVEAGGGKVFARLDHAAAAEEAGLELRPTQVLIFGNPKGGTPLMQANPALSVDLPLKIAAYAGEDGTVMVWRDPSAQFGPLGLDKPAANISGMLDTLASKAAAEE